MLNRLRISRLAFALSASLGALSAMSCTVKLNNMAVVSQTSTTVVLPAPPSAPTLPSAEITVANSIDLAWTASTGTGPVTYSIKRSAVMGGPYTSVGTTTGTTFVDTTANGIAAGTQYYYVISASNAGGSSGDSSEVTAIAIASFTITSATAANKQVTVVWPAVTGSTSFTLKYGAASGSHTVVHSAAAASPATVTGLGNGIAYYFMVVAKNAYGSVNATAQATATPNGPQGFDILSATPGATSVTLAWSASSGATSYTVRYGTASGAYGTTDSVSATSPHPVNGLVADTPYYFMVDAVNANGTVSAHSEFVATPGSNNWLNFGDLGAHGCGSGNWMMRFNTANDPFVLIRGCFPGMSVYVNSAGTWGQLGGADVGDSYSSTTSAFSFDLLDNPVVLMTDNADSGGGYRLNLYQYSGGTWGLLPGSTHFSTAPDVWDQVAVETDTNVASTYRHYAAYVDDATDKVTVMRYNEGATTWSTLRSMPTAAGAGYCVSTAIDNSTDPATLYVGYMDESLGDHYTVESWDGTSWATIGGAAGVSAHVSYCPKMVLDPQAGNKVIYVAYKRPNLSNEISVVSSTNGAAFAQLGAAGFITGASPVVWDLTVDTVNHVPYIGYSDLMKIERTTVMGYVGGAWKVIGNPGFHDGAPYVSSWIGANRSMAMAVNQGTLYAAVPDQTSWFNILSYDNRDPGATKLTWAQTYPTAVTNLTAQWVSSTSPDLLSESIELYEDDHCTDNLINTFAVGVPGTYSYAGTAGKQYSFRIVTTYTGASGIDPLLSKCSPPMAITPTFAKIEGSHPAVNTTNDSFQSTVAIDKANRIYMVYSDTDISDGYKISVKRHAGGEWTKIGDRFADGNMASIALDSGGKPYIAYSDIGNGYAITVQKYENNAWSVPAGSTGFGTIPTRGPWYNGLKIAIDPTDDLPVVAYRQSNTRITVRKYDGVGAWNLVGAAAFTPNTDEFDFAIDRAGGMHVIYKNAGTNRAGVMNYTSGAWATEGTGGGSISTGQAYFPRIAINPMTDMPVIAFFDAGAGTRVKVFELSGTTWNSLGSTYQSYNYAQGIGLGVAPDGVIYLSFGDASEGASQSVASYAYPSGPWTYVLPAGSVSAYGPYAGDILFDASGSPVLTYHSYVMNMAMVIRRWVP